MVLTLLTILCYLPTVLTGYSNPGPLGLMDGRIADWQLSASSFSRDPKCHIKHARVNQPNGKAWCAKKKPNEWLLVDLGVVSKITGIITQGRGDGKQWVASFYLSHSLDAHKWLFVSDVYGKKKKFNGNFDSHSLRHNYLEKSVTAKFVRVHILEWHHHPSLRLELIGHQECNEVISFPPFTKFSSSSHGQWEKHKSCLPEYGDIHSQKAWCSRRQNTNQWLQFDLGPPTLIKGFITRGRGDSQRKHWVQSYSVSYSNDTLLWYFYKDANHLDIKQVFGGNMDKNTERRHYLNQPFAARYVRFHPLTWHKRVALRAAVIGCPHRGDCGPGFIRVNEGSACVENIAYKKPTWVSDERSSWKDWQYGHSSLATDGDQSKALSKCTILDNYYVDVPLWMVDLGSKQRIDGVIIYTWQGQGQDKTTLYRDYVYNLQNFTVYIGEKPKQTRLVDDMAIKCSSISRQNNAMFKPRLHFECPRPIRGRYLYVEAMGVPNRWTRLFTMILCEVQVY